MDHDTTPSPRAGLGRDAEQDPGEGAGGALSPGSPRPPAPPARGEGRRDGGRGTKTSNAAIGIALASVVGGMVALSFAAVPLYKLFCSVTGYGGTPQVGLAAAPGRASGTVTVRFDADTNPNLPWHFQPDQKEVHLKLGDEQVAFYSARNEAGVPVTGIAVYNVTPDVVGKYFHKTACFCFNQQTLAPNQKMEFPVSFWVDPAIAKDPNTSDIKVITLSYTFFRSLDDAAKSGALAKAGPHVGPLVR